MSTRKTKIESAAVTDFLQKNFNQSVSAVAQLEGGEMSCPFGFKVENEEFVVRIDTLDNYSYNKDAYAYTHFSSEKLPIPKMVKVGQFDASHCFAITKRAAGKMLEKLSVEETRAIMPSIITTLESIHAIDISHTKGYGYWHDKNGNAPCVSWKEHLVLESKKYHTWLTNHPESFLEREFLKKLYEKIVSLTVYCPEERYLVHGDYGFSNTLVDEKGVTAIIDWGESRYGDFLYDVSWLAIYEKRFDYGAIFKKHYAAKQKQVKHFDQRMLCYRLLIMQSAFYFWIDSKEFAYAKEYAEKVRSLL